MENLSLVGDGVARFSDARLIGDFRASVPGMSDQAFPVSPVNWMFAKNIRLNGQLVDVPKTTVYSAVFVGEKSSWRIPVAVGESQWRSFRENFTVVKSNKRFYTFNVIGQITDNLLIVKQQVSILRAFFLAPIFCRQYVLQITNPETRESFSGSTAMLCPVITEGNGYDRSFREEPSPELSEAIESFESFIASVSGKPKVEYFGFME